MQILDPELGGKIRAVITSLFAIGVFAVEQFDLQTSEAWTIVGKVVAIALVAVQALTHYSDIGNQTAGE